MHASDERHQFLSKAGAAAVLFIRDRPESSLLRTATVTADGKDANVSTARSEHTACVAAAASDWG